MSTMKLSVLAGGLVLAVMGCATREAPVVKKIKLPRNGAADVTCPKGAPTFRIKDARTVIWECPEGGEPIVVEVVRK